MKLILVRHGETEWNRQSRIVGHAEISLNDTGRRQASLLAQALLKEHVSAIYASPLRRTRETADEIARVLGIGVVFDEALKEVDAGEVDGLTFKEVADRYSDFFEVWMKGDPALKLPGGESVTDLQGRTWPSVKKIVSENNNGAVVVVSHTLAIMSIIASALEMDIAYFRRLRLSIASISVLEFGERGVSLLRFNDVCHWGQPKMNWL
ncbi:MAG: histidine phosphatase family protein [Chloroflexota bacterium]|nr:histidine phosphatase family protein [Chloroflexota bacterium]